MKRIAPLLVLALVLTCVFAPVAWAASAKSTAATRDRSPGAPIAGAITTITGIAISPLLGTGAYGAYQWITAENSEARAALPWYAQVKFWLPALLIVGVVALKDSFGTTVPPMLKKPLDILEVVENKFSGLIAAGAVVPFAVDSLTKILIESVQTEGMGTGGLAMIPFFGMSWAPVLDVLTIPIGIAVFLVVWMASHAINVLILLSPWGAIDAGLKAARTGLLGLMTVTTWMNPVVGALLSIAIIIFAYLIAGWAFRLSVFGAIVSWDFFTRRRRRFTPASDANLMFAGARIDGVPVRTYGRLVKAADGALEFVYRPWLVMRPKKTPVPVPAAHLAVGSGLFFSVIMPETGGNLFVLPPRYRGHELKMVDTYQLGGGMQPAGLRKAWAGFKELIRGKPAPVPEAIAG